MNNLALKCVNIKKFNVNGFKKLKICDRFRTLGNNLLTIISDADFPKLNNLKILLLKRNQLMKISEKAFSNLTNLKVL